MNVSPKVNRHKRMSASHIRKFIPDLKRVGTPPNRYWIAFGVKYNTLQEVVTANAHRFPEFAEMVRIAKPPVVSPEYKRGTQIAYVPDHVIPPSNLGHPDVEFGFVMDDKGDVCFCRYWIKGKPGELRTVANSEGTPKRMLRMVTSVRQHVVDHAVAVLEDVETGLIKSLKTATEMDLVELQAEARKQDDMVTLRAVLLEMRERAKAKQEAQE